MSIESAHTPVASAPRIKVRGDRHRLLLEAVLDVVSAEGVDAVRHRRVAELAGVPLGSTTYYFSSREDMLVQALAYFVDADLDALTARLGEATGGEGANGESDIDKIVDGLADFLVLQLGDRRSLAQYALFHEATRRPELRPVVREWSDAWCAVLASLLASLGARDPQFGARMLLALLDGLMLSQLAAPEENFDDAVLRPALHHWLTTAAEGD